MIPSEQPKKIIGETLTMFTTALGLVAALAWNEAVKTLIGTFLPQGQGVWSLFGYAIIVTVLAVFLSSRLWKIKQRLEGSEQ